MPFDQATLDAYEREKWAQLSDEGPDTLRRELARLEAFLAAHARGEDPYAGRVMEVDVPFREAKVAILRRVLASKTERP